MNDLTLFNSCDFSIHSIHVGMTSNLIVDLIYQYAMLIHIMFLIQTSLCFRDLCRLPFTSFKNDLTLSFINLIQSNIIHNLKLKCLPKIEYDFFLLTGIQAKD